MMLPNVWIRIANHKYPYWWFDSPVADLPRSQVTPGLASSCFNSYDQENTKANQGPTSSSPSSRRLWTTRQLFKLSSIYPLLLQSSISKAAYSRRFRWGAEDLASFHYWIPNWIESWTFRRLKLNDVALDVVAGTCASGSALTSKRLSPRIFFRMSNYTAAKTNWG